MKTLFWNCVCGFCVGLVFLTVAIGVGMVSIPFLVLACSYLGITAMIQFLGKRVFSRLWFRVAGNAK